MCVRERERKKELFEEYFVMFQRNFFVFFLMLVASNFELSVKRCTELRGYRVCTTVCRSGWGESCLVKKAPTTQTSLSGTSPKIFRPQTPSLRPTRPASDLFWLSCFLPRFHLIWGGGRSRVIKLLVTISFLLGHFVWCWILCCNNSWQLHRVPADVHEHLLCM